MSATATRIRRLFLEPKPTYSITEAADLLDMRPRDVRGWIDTGEIEPVEIAEGIALPWTEIVSFGMDFWSQQVVEAALGEDLADAIPELLRLTAFEVHIPRLEVIALEKIAARDNRSVDAVLARELLDVISAHSDWLAREIAGFAEVMEWPSQLLDRA